MSEILDTAQEVLSLRNRVWELSKVVECDVLRIMQKYRISEIAARVMAGRNISDEENFLNPLLRTSLPDPFHLLDMEKGVARVITALKNKEKIVVFGDYDVDGATSSALLKRYFAELGSQISIYIPDRVKEGYGPNSQALRKLKAKGQDLCITVDCGVVAHEPLLEAKKVGLDIIVIDHHLGSETLPEAWAIINPNRLDENSEHRELAAVGVTFLFLIALNKTLRDSRFFTSREEPNLYDYLDLVALGTVCDVVPLINLNRVFVAQGLKVIAKRKNLGVRILADLVEIYEPITSYHLGFLIGPHINAGGRIGESGLGANLLSTNDEFKAEEIAQELIKCNKERRELEKSATQEALKQAEFDLDRIIMIVSSSWHPGIIGIIASRVKDEFYLPTIIVTIKDGIGKASCRSVKGVDMGSLVLAAKLEGLIIEGGGHKMAAGFSVAEEKINELKDFFKSQIASNKIKNIMKVDAVTIPDMLNLKLWYDLQKLAPFGASHPEPKFILQNVALKDIRVIKDAHVGCVIYNKITGKSIRGIAFGVVDTEVGEALVKNKVTQILGKIKANYWQGRVSLNFVIDDAVYLQ